VGLTALWPACEGCVGPGRFPALSPGTPDRFDVSQPSLVKAQECCKAIPERGRSGGAAVSAAGQWCRRHGRMSPVGQHPGSAEARASMTPPRFPRSVHAEPCVLRMIFDDSAGAGTEKLCPFSDQLRPALATSRRDASARHLSVTNGVPLLSEGAPVFRRPREATEARGSSPSGDPSTSDGARSAHVRLSTRYTVRRAVARRRRLWYHRQSCSILARLPL